jgi:hypothetical protein
VGPGSVDSGSGFGVGGTLVGFQHSKDVQEVILRWFVGIW